MTTQPTRALWIAIACALPLGLTACGGGEEAGHGEDGGHGTEQTGDAAAFTPAPDDARVWFKSPEDGAEVTSPVALSFGVEGMTVRPAGEQGEDSGHHHVLIGKDHYPEGKIIPADETHIHYGDGSTEVEVELEPGEYQLTMQFADFIHRSYGPPMAESITVTVVEE